MKRTALAIVPLLALAACGGESPTLVAPASTGQASTPSVQPTTIEGLKLGDKVTLPKRTYEVKKVQKYERSYGGSVVAILVRACNTDTKNTEFSPQWWSIADSSGVSHQSSYGGRPEDPKPPYSGNIQVRPGKCFEGWVTTESWTGAKPSSVDFSNSASENVSWKLV